MRDSEEERTVAPRIGPWAVLVSGGLLGANIVVLAFDAFVGFWGHIMGAWLLTGITCVVLATIGVASRQRYRVWALPALLAALMAMLILLVNGAIALARFG